MKASLVVLSDPDGGEEALGRVFNALAAAKDLAERGDDVTVVFQGTGTRWPALLAAVDHPLHGLYSAVAPQVAGASQACAAFFGATAGATSAGVALVAEHNIDGVGGLPSLGAALADGRSVITF
jgi:hypothetical protein